MGGNKEEKNYNLIRVYLGMYPSSLLQSHAQQLGLQNPLRGLQGTAQVSNIPSYQARTQSFFKEKYI